MSWAMLGVCAALFASAVVAQEAPQTSRADAKLRVCADPDNLPLSKARGGG